MGTSMASLAFRYDNADKKQLMEKLKASFDGVEGIVHNFDTDGPGYAAVSPYGDMGMFLSEYSEQISALINDYVIMTICNDSDFSILMLYHNGALLEQCAIGEIYEEMAEICGFVEPTVDLWKKLLLNCDELPALEDALYTQEIFAEDNLRKLSKLFGMPIFDNKMVFETI